MTYESPFPALAGRAYAILKFDFPDRMRTADVAAWIAEYERVMFGASDRALPSNPQSEEQAIKETA